MAVPYVFIFAVVTLQNMNEAYLASSCYLVHTTLSIPYTYADCIYCFVYFTPHGRVWVNHCYDEVPHLGASKVRDYPVSLDHDCLHWSYSVGLNPLR